MKFFFPFQRSKPKPEANRELTTTRTNNPIPTSHQVSNEANVIAHIRSLIPQLKALGIQNRRNHLLQSEEYIKDIDAPAKPSRFTDLEESNKQLRDSYELITDEIHQQIAIYDRYCERHELDYSVEWNKLLADVKGYMGGIGSGGALHLEEAVKGFVRPSSESSNNN
jgi:hypothetical protein